MNRLGIALALVALTSCTKYVTVEEQGLGPEGAEGVGGRPEGSGGSSGSGGSKGENKGRLEAAEAGAVIERITSDPQDELFPVANQDGSIVLFQAEAYEGKGAERKLGSQVLYGIDPSTRGQRTLYTTEGRAASHPSFFPDAQSYVYVTNAMGPLAIVKALSSAPNAAISVVISSDLAPEPSEPAVSPDGSKVAFSMKDKSGGRSLAVIGTDGAKLTLIGEGRSPAWSPSGDRLAFIRSVNSFNHVFTVNAATFGSLSQVTNGEFDCDDPFFSPDGKYLTFASNRGHKELRKGRADVLQIFVIKTDGTGLSQLTRGAAKAATPSWGPDGWIYFSSDRDGTFDIYRIKLTGPLAEIKPPKVDAPPAPKPEPTGCSKDTDCKGDRVCDGGQCIEPKPW